MLHFNLSFLILFQVGMINSQGPTAHPGGRTNFQKGHFSYNFTVSIYLEARMFRLFLNI